MLRTYRCRRGSVVAFYIAKYVSYQQINIDYTPCSQLEQICVSAKILETRMAIGCVYKHLLTPLAIFSDLKTVLSNIVLEHNGVVLEDINVDFLSLNPKRIFLNNIFEPYGLRLIITDSTRKSEISSTAVDRWPQQSIVTSRFWQWLHS